MVYICATCSGEFKTEAEIEEHWRKVGVPVPKIKEWKCPRCLGIFMDDLVVRTATLGGLKYRPKKPLCPVCYMVSLEPIDA